jgi:hypothetical protein
MELEHEPDVSVPKLDHVGIAHRRDLSIRHVDGTGVRSIEGAEQVQQRALANARCADDRQHLALRHLEIEIAEHVNALAADDERFVESGDVYKGHGRLVIRRVDTQHYSNRRACTGSRRDAWRDG